MKKNNKIVMSTIVALAVAGTTAFGTTGKVYNTSQGLVLRGAASKSGEPLATVADGAEVEILDNNGEWYKVNANGKEGFLFAEYVKVEEEKQALVETETINDNANTNIINSEKKIYILPVITSTVVGVIPAETELLVEKTLGNWNYVSFENIKGWVRNASSTVEVAIKSEKEESKELEKEQEEEQPQQEIQTMEETTKTTENTDLSFTKGYINSSSVNVRKEPTKSSEILTTLILNTGVTITAQTDEWYKIEYGDYKGYIHKSLISDKPVSTSRNGEARAVLIEEEKVTVKQEEVKSEQVVTTNSSSVAGENIVSFAKQYLGFPYVYGGTTPGGGFDCSGFVYYVFNSCGYSISRSCSVQAQSGIAVSRAQLQPGDILFFNNTSNGSIGHTGIYIGEGRFIHAANPKRGVVTDTINSGYYNTYYYSARRVAN